MKRSAFVLAVVLGLSSSREARAYYAAASGRSLFVPRAFVCHEERAAAPTPSPVVRLSGAGPTTLVPVPRTPSAPTLDVVPHPPDDVAFTEPLPSRVFRPPATPEIAPPVVALRESENDWRCLGYVRGKPGIVRVIEAPPGSRFYHHGYSESAWLQETIVASAAFGVAEAIPGLRRWISKPIPKRIERHDDFERVRTVALAADALAELGDRESSPRIHELLVNLETVNFGGAWRDTFRALARNDASEAGRYAVEVVEKLAARRLPLDRAHEYLEVLPYLDVADRARALPALVTLTTKTELASLGDHVAHEACRVYGARLRLGDEALAREVRKPLTTSLDTNLATVCYRDMIAALYPGRDVAELPVLVYRGRHREIVELVRRLSADGSREAAASRSKVLAQLAHPKMASNPRLAGEGVIESERALWLAARAGLGDASARDALSAWIDDPRHASDGPWIALWAALYLDLPGALEHAERRLRIGIEQAPPSVRETDIDRGGTAVTWRVRVLDELHARRSPLVGLGLLQTDTWARERALFLLSRRHDAPACALVRSGLATTHEDVVDEALWSLTTLGASCASEIEHVARDASAAPRTRGMAMEHLAMVKSPVALPLAESWSPGPHAYPENASRGRVRIIVRSPE